MDPESVKKEICWIVAGNASEFTDYVKRKHQQYAILRQECPHEYRYVGGVDVLRGHTDIKGFFIGGWRTRPDIAEIKQQIEISKRWRNDWISPQEGVQAGAEALAKEIDAEVLRQLMSKPATGPEWRAVVNDGSIFEYLAKS